MRSHATLYGLIGALAKAGGFAGATGVLIVGSFCGISGRALFLRVALVFLVVTIVFNLVGLVTVRSLLSAIVAESEERKGMADSKRRASGSP